MATKHPGPWKVFGGERTEAILDGNGDIVVQARPLEGGRAVLEFGSDDARNQILNAPKVFGYLEKLVVAWDNEKANDFFRALKDARTLFDEETPVLIARLEETT